MGVRLSPESWVCTAVQSAMLALPLSLEGVGAVLEMCIRDRYRKPQEKRKQMIAPDLFEFAYVPDWYGHLAELERLALPERCV